MKFVVFLFLLLSTNSYEEVHIIDLIYHTHEEGKIHVAVYDNEKDFLSQDVNYIGLVLEEGQREAQIKIPANIKSIAIAAFQDCNNNDVFDLNIIGIPKESYAITNDCRAKWREPTFEEATVDPSKVELLAFKLEYWSNR